MSLSSRKNTKNLLGLTARFDEAKAWLEMVEAEIKDKESRQTTIEAYLKDDVRFTFKGGMEIKA